MKQYKSIYIGIVMATFTILLSGCIAAELAELAELGEASELAAGGEATLAEFGGVATEEGLSIENTRVFNQNLPRLRLMRGASNPEIGIMENGRPNSVAEVLTRENRIRLNNGKLIPMHKEIYAINVDEILVRESSSSTGRVVSRLSKDNLVLKLHEENGWYKVRYGQYEEGFVNPAFLLFVGGDIKDKKKYCALTHSKSISSFIQDNTIKNGRNTKDVALVVADSLEADEGFTLQMKKILEDQGYKVYTTLFNNEFITDGYFKLLFDGEVKNFEKLKIDKYVDFICMVYKPVRVTNNQFKDMVSAKSLVNIQVFSASTGFVIDSKFFPLAGAGFSSKQAYETLNKHIVQKIESSPFNF